MKKNRWITAGIFSGILGIVVSLALSVYACMPGEARNLPVVPANTPTSLEKQSNHWFSISESQYYIREDGKVAHGWQDIGEYRYYFLANGKMHTSWLELDGDRYYFRENGTMVKGQITLDGVNHFFTSTGKYVLLVNHQIPVPDDYQVELVNIETIQISQVALADLQEMLTAARAEGHRCAMSYGYRSYTFQKSIWDRNVNTNMLAGHDYNTACAITSQTVMTPGHSEHQTGLAIDFDTSTQGITQWLHEHAWEYGFILRYPTGKTHLTGIVYEPWHYRYVGKELAKELYESGLCMEEYMEMLTAQNP